MSLEDFEPESDRFEGHADRECGDHRTTGGRAWCFDCSEWCYPEAPCPRCELPALRAAATAYVEADGSAGCFDARALMQARLDLYAALQRPLTDDLRAYQAALNEEATDAR